eukprot:TRINITY_DN58072_c0_g1_i1.p1 TRINITY_DN58072_c0_g1~~TRINITY_DN58072_c0_g1_i1.p1  ORF type:complete len:958 (-),score=147.18 TRINITY_DN58072_c0_g1_i1:93-2789(-)
MNSEVYSSHGSPGSADAEQGTQRKSQQLVPVELARCDADPELAGIEESHAEVSGAPDRTDYAGELAKDTVVSLPGMSMKLLLPAQLPPDLSSPSRGQDSTSSRQSSKRAGLEEQNKCSSSALELTERAAGCLGIGPGFDEAGMLKAVGLAETMKNGRNSISSFSSSGVKQQARRGSLLSIENPNPEEIRKHSNSAKNSRASFRKSSIASVSSTSSQFDAVQRRSSGPNLRRVSTSSIISQASGIEGRRRWSSASNTPARRMSLLGGTTQVGSQHSVLRGMGIIPGGATEELRSQRRGALKNDEDSGSSLSRQQNEDISIDSDDSESNMTESSESSEEFDPLSSEFNLLPIWRNRLNQRLRVLKEIRGENASVLGSESESMKHHQRFIILPGSMWRMTWDVTAACFVVVDVVSVPLDLVSIQLDASWLSADALLAAIFWTMDMPMNMLTCHETEDGSMETRLMALINRYAKTDGPLELGLVIITWLGVYIKQPQLRMLKLLRLLRLLRVQGLVNMVANRLHSERTALLMNIIVNILCIMCEVHILACMWVGLGQQTGGWVAQLRASIGAISDFGNTDLDLYIYSYHWALCQFYGNGEHIVITFSERLFAVLSLLLAWFTATAFVASLTSSMTRLYILTGQQGAHTRVLRNYLREQKISVRLSSRVMQNAKRAIGDQQKNIPEIDVELLKLVSDPLRVELHFEMNAPILSHHPLFFEMSLSMASTLRKLCHSGVSTSLVSQADVIFSRGEVPSVPPKMVFVSRGILRYSTNNEGFETVGEGQWVSEHVLWTNWIYHGVLIAETACRLILVDASVFQDLVNEIQHCAVNFGAYANEFLTEINKQESIHRTDVGNATEVKLFLERAAKRPSRRPSMVSSGSQETQNTLAAPTSAKRPAPRIS